MMLWTPHKAIFRRQKISHKNGAMEIWDIWAKMGPFWDPGDPEGTQYQVKVCGDHESNPGGPIGGSWDQIWSLGALRGPLGPPKGAFRAKTVSFRAPRDPEGAPYQVKVCGEHDSNPEWPIGGRWDQIWPPRALRGPQRSPKGPFMAKTGPFCLFLIVFSNWVVLYGL